MRITYDDCRKAGWCIEGVERWFARVGGDFADFIANGIDADDLVALSDDAFTRRVIARKRAEG